MKSLGIAGGTLMWQLVFASSPDVYMVRQGATTLWERWDSDERIGSEGKSRHFDVTDGEWQTYTIDMPPQDSPVTGLRLDAVRETATIKIDHIRVYY